MVKHFFFKGYFGHLILHVCKVRGLDGQTRNTCKAIAITDAAEAMVWWLLVSNLNQVESCSSHNANRLDPPCLIKVLHYLKIKNPWWCHCGKITLITSSVKCLFKCKLLHDFIIFHILCHKLQKQTGPAVTLQGTSLTHCILLHFHTHNIQLWSCVWMCVCLLYLPSSTLWSSALLLSWCASLKPSYRTPPPLPHTRSRWADAGW